MKNNFCLALFTLFMLGCPSEENNEECEKVMECQEDSEMVCDKREDDCGQDCHYYVVEHCYEVCKK